MDIDIAKSIISESFREYEGKYDFLEFTYLGGEPFMTFSMLRELSEWIWSKDWPISYRISVVTNGTLLTGDIKSWLEKNSNRISLVISFDGEKGQNITRSDSLSQVDLDWYHSFWPDAPVKMTIAEQNVRTIFQDITSLWERGIPVNDTFSGGVDPWSKENLEELDRQLIMLTEYLLKNLTPFRSNLLSIDLTGVLYPDDSCCFTCGAGDCRITYDIDGNSYPCHLLSPLVLTKVEQIRYGAGEIPFSQDSRCAKCIFNNICPKCDGNSFRFFGCFGRRERLICSLFRRQVVHACRFQAKEILRRSNITQFDRNTILAIDKIMRNLNSNELEMD